MERDEFLKRLPAVGRLLDDPAFADAVSRWGRSLITALLREELERLRTRARDGAVEECVAAASDLARAVSNRAETLLAPSPRVVINATGVIAHTNLGRSVLSPAAAHRVAETAAGYLDLEYDLAHGERGDRMAHL